MYQIVAICRSRFVRDNGYLSLPFWAVLILGVFVIACPMANTGEIGSPLSAGFDLGEEAEQGESKAGEVDSADEGGVDANVNGLWDEERLGQLVSLDPGPMTEFFKALSSQEPGGGGLVRVLHYGDSHTAADFLCTAIRRTLQKRFGDGGRGFVLLGKPWRSYHPKDVEMKARGAWETHRILIGADPASLDGRYGLAGVAVDSRFKNAAASVATVGSTGFGSRVSSFEVFFLEQPDGGSFEIHVDGKWRGTVNTGRQKIGSGFFRLELTEGAHEVEIRLKGNGKVRLFGAVMENDGPGVVYDTLGINGAFFYTPLRWDASLLEEQVARRNPDLIVTMYGANEADSRTLTPDGYALEVKNTLARLRAGAPEAACLLLGPTDRRMSRSSRDGDKPTKLDWIIEVQQAVADEVGCAFLDTRMLMGGEGSHGLWESRRMAQPDGIHLTVSGYMVLGRMVAKEILDAYEVYLGAIESPDSFDKRVGLDGISKKLD